MPATTPTPALWNKETNLNPVPPTPLVLLASLIIGILVLLGGGLLINDRLPNNPEQPVIDQNLGQ